MRSSTTAGYGSTRLAALETLEQRRLLTTYLVDDSWSAGPRPAKPPPSPAKPPPSLPGSSCPPSLLAGRGPAVPAPPSHGAAFRRPTSSMDKLMVWSYGRKPRVTVAAAENPDGTWAVGLSNYTHTPVSEDARDFYKQNAGYPTEAFEVDLGIDELSGAGTVEFAVTRSGPDGDAMREAAGAGTVTMRDGRVKLQVHPLELVTLRSTAPVD